MKRLLMCATLALAASVWSTSAYADECGPDSTDYFECSDETFRVGANRAPSGLIGIFTPFSAGDPHVVVLPPNPVFPVDPILPPNPVITNPALRR